METVNEIYIEMNKILNEYKEMDSKSVEENMIFLKTYPIG